VDGDPEALLDLPRQLLRRDGGLLGTGGLEVRQNLRGEFVGGFAARLARHQTVQALEGKEAFGFVKGGSRQSEIPRDLAQGAALGFEGSDRLVFNLQQVARIEEPAGEEKGMADFVGAGMKGATGVEGMELRVVRWRCWHKQYVN
jgi:hypothetical protein